MKWQKSDLKEKAHKWNQLLVSTFFSGKTGKNCVFSMPNQVLEC